MIWLSLDQIVDLHSQLMQVTGGLDGIRDHGILESTLAAPMLTYDSADYDKLFMWVKAHVV